MNMKPLNVSSSQHTPEGILIGKLYYTGLLAALLRRDEYSGYPHNGSEHTLSLRLTPPDLEAFLLLVKEHCSKAGPVWVARAEAFIAHVKTKAKLR